MQHFVRLCVELCRGGWAQLRDTHAHVHVYDVETFVQEFLYERSAQNEFLHKYTVEPLSYGQNNCLT